MSGARRAFGRFAEFFALSALAIGQPWLDVTAKNSEVLVVRGATMGQGVTLIVIVLLVPPLSALLLEFLLGWRWPRSQPWVHAVLGGIFAVVLGAEIVKHQLGLGPQLVVTGGLLAGIVGVGLLVRFVVVGTYLRVVAAILAVVVPVSFLVTSPAARALRADPNVSPRHLGSARPARVVLVILDELPTMSLLDGSGHIDRGLFPNLGALAATGTWFRNHTTVAGFTAGAVPAILSGRYPTDQTKPAQLSSYPNNLFTLMHSVGTVNGREAVTRLCPESVCVNGDTGLAGIVDSSGALWRDFASPERTVPKTADVDQARRAVASADSFVRSLVPRRGVHLDAVHLEIPHFPWERLPDLRRYDVPAEPLGESYAVTPGGPGAATARERHLVQVQAADTIVGRIVHRLRTIGAFDQSIVIVTADHGAAFVPGTSVRNPTARNLASVMWAPLIVKYPHQAGAVVDDRRSESVDIVPTVADVLGIRLPYRTNGVSLRASAPSRPVRRLYPWIWFPGPDDVPVPRGRSYIEVGGARQFQEVLEARAAPPGGEPELRPYRISPFGELIGRKVEDIPVRSGTRCRASVHDDGRFRAVDPSAKRPNWVWNRGVASGGTGLSRWFAISANGTVAAVAATVPGPSPQAFTFLVPPSMVVAGRNDVRIDEIFGSYLVPMVTRCRPIRALATGRDRADPSRTIRDGSP